MKKRKTTRLGRTDYYDYNVKVAEQHRHYEDTDPIGDWIIENIKGLWIVSDAYSEGPYDSYCFENQNDAALFALRWS